MDDDLEYECPECGAPLLEDAKICNACKATFDQEEDEEEAVDELLEEIDKSREPEEVEEAEATDTEPPYDPSVEAEEEPEEETPIALEGPVGKKKALSMLGIAFAVLTVISVIGLMVVLNYDVWINGDAENNIGDTQMMYVYLAVVAVIVCPLLVVFDFVRNRKAA